MKTVLIVESNDSREETWRTFYAQFFPNIVIFFAKTLLAALSILEELYSTGCTISLIQINPWMKACCIESLTHTNFGTTLTLVATQLGIPFLGVGNPLLEFSLGGQPYYYWPVETTTWRKGIESLLGMGEGGV